MRQACAIHSATAGSILNVPREDRINRLYIQLGLEDNSHNRDQITPKVMLAVARRIMAPYTLDYKHCDWWSLYKVSRGLGPNFVPSNNSLYRLAKECLPNSALTAGRDPPACFVSWGVN